LTNAATDEKEQTAVTRGLHWQQGDSLSTAPTPRHIVAEGRAYSNLGPILDAIRRPLIVLDEKLRVISANRAFYRAFAIVPNETIGRHLAAVGACYLDLPAFGGLLDLLQAEDAVIEDFEIEIELPTVGRRVLLLNAGKIRGEHEATCEIVMAVDDVTERRRAEAALQSTRWHAERANLGKSRLFAAASHDLRQPLQTLSLMRGILAKKIKDKKNEEALELVVRLNETADGLSSMLNALLDINQIETGIVHPDRVRAVILNDDNSMDTIREITGKGCVQRNKPVRAEELTRLIPYCPPSLGNGQCGQTRCRRSIGEVALPGPTIFVVDDESPAREAMRGLLQEDGWAVEVYSSGEAFLDAYRPGREGCLVVDAWMPRMSGLELLERLSAEGGGPPAIMIAGHADIRLAVRAMKAGATAFLERPVQYDELVVNIERALELTRNSAALSPLREAAATRIAALTMRERQVVRMVVEGKPNKQIAYVIGISQRTVETHRATAMKKVGARTLSELIHLTIAGSTHDT
jgi:FixJ family two-component response regulator